MPINYYSVLNHLEQEGWQLISTEYKNLDTELEMICPQGHAQKQTYKQWRKHPLCEQCMAGDPFKIKKNKVPVKKTDTYRILALDAATNITGYAIFDDGALVSYGTFKTDGSKEATARIHEVKLWLLAAINEWKPDLIGIEHIQLQSYGTRGQPQVEMYRVLANLQGVLLDTLFDTGLHYELAYSSSWRRYCGIDEKGRENKKKQAQDKVKAWYQQNCTQDEADAICLGKYFVNETSKVGWGEKLYD